MDSLEQFTDVVRWTGAEKKVARRAFDAALERHLSAITALAKRMMANVADPSDLWQDAPRLGRMRFHNSLLAPEVFFRGVMRKSLVGPLESVFAMQSARTDLILITKPSGTSCLWTCPLTGSPGGGSGMPGPDSCVVVPGCSELPILGPTCADAA